MARRRYAALVPRALGLLVLVPVLASCSHSRGPSSGAVDMNNPGTKAVVVTLSQWGRCMIDGGVKLSTAMHYVRGQRHNNGILLTLASGDQFLVVRPAQPTAVSSAANERARAHVAAGLARDPACHTTHALSASAARTFVETFG